jgi:hypothetical protein
MKYHPIVDFSNTPTCQHLRLVNKNQSEDDILVKQLCNNNIDITFKQYTFDVQDIFTIPKSCLTADTKLIIDAIYDIKVENCKNVDTVSLKTSGGTILYDRIVDHNTFRIPLAYDNEPMHYFWEQSGWLTLNVSMIPNVVLNGDLVIEFNKGASAKVTIGAAALGKLKYRELMRSTVNFYIDGTLYVKTFQGDILKKEHTSKTSCCVQ